MSATPEPPPVVCTLTPVQLGRRSLEWSDLAALALSRQAVEGGVVCTYPLEYAEQIDDLASREQSCCGSWLDSVLTRGNDHVRLELTTTNPDGQAIIEAMAGTPAE